MRFPANFKLPRSGHFFAAQSEKKRRLLVRVNSRKPASRSFDRAAGTSGYGGIVENFSLSSRLSASLILMPCVSASIFITADPISVKGTYEPARVRAREYVTRFA